MSTEDEQNELYRSYEVENVYDILCDYFLKTENAFKFQESSLENKKKILKELAEDLIS